MQALETALDHLQQLDALRPLSADQEQRIWQKFRLDWNYHSNNLEGNSLTYGETKLLIMHGMTAQGKPLQHHFEITGHNEAINEIHDAVKKQLPITETFLRQLHELILKQRYQVDAQTADGSPTKKWIEVGQYKTQPNHVLTQTGEVFRFAEPFEVPAKMHDLLAEANTRPNSPAEGLLLASKLHYQFVLIHPFDDGNGRMARILMNLVLMQSGFPPAIIKTEAKEAYLAALRLADGGQFEMFAEYIAERVSESLKIMIAGAKGLPIDDPDDIDKQIRLFIATAKQHVGHLPVALSPSILATFYQEVILKLGAKLEHKVNEFSKLYSASRLELIDQTGTTRYRLKELSQGSEIPSVFLNSNRLQISQHFDALSLIDGANNYDSVIHIRFDIYKAQAYLNDSILVASVSYNAPSFGDFINSIVKASSEDHLAWLKGVSGISSPN
jgi:Fic family protein